MAFGTTDKISINVARYKKEGIVFEVVVDPDTAVMYKEKNQGDLRDILNVENVFTDAKKGMLAAETDLERVFQTTDTLRVAETIIKDGEIQLSAEYRAKKREEKHRKIVVLIQRNGIDPTTKLPHPATRIENAMAEAKVKIDDHKSAEDQLEDIVKKLRVVIPIKFEQRTLVITIPATVAGKCYGSLRGFGTIVEEKWQNDGSLFCKIEMPAGLQGDFVDQINKVTAGAADIKVQGEK